MLYLNSTRCRYSHVDFLSQSITMLDLSYLNAKSILVRQYESLHLWVIGCGGTGSYTCNFIARFAHLLSQLGKSVKVSFVDPDVVEPKNLTRQQFTYAELGFPKAKVLALRYAQAWGVFIEAIVAPFKPSLVSGQNSYILNILIGCVDNHLARKAIASCLDANGDLPHFWYIDSGNSFNAGQILIGSHNKTPCSWFNDLDLCVALPSPLVQEPKLGEAQGEQKEIKSCVEIQQHDRQSWTVNQRAAAEISEYVLQLLSGSLKRYATYYDLAAGTLRSNYITTGGLSRAGGLITYESKTYADLATVSSDKKAI